MPTSLFDLPDPGSAQAQAPQSKSLYDLPDPNSATSTPSASGWEDYVPEGTKEAIKQGALGFAQGAQERLGDIIEAVRGPFGRGAQSVQAMKNAPEPTADDIEKYGSRANYYRSFIKPTYGEDIVKGTGVEANPQTPGQNIMANVGEMASNPLSLMGGGTGLVSNLGRVGNIVGSAVGTEGGRELDDTIFQGTPFEGWGQFAGGILGGVVAGTGSATATNALRRKLSTQELKDTSNGEFAEARSLGVQYDPNKVFQLQNKINQDLWTRGYRNDRSGGTFSRVGELTDPPAQNLNHDFSDIEGKRQSLVQLRNDMWSTTGKPTAEAAAADIAIDHIDDFLADPTNATAATAANAQRASELAESARGNWQAMARAQQLEFALNKGVLNAKTSGSGSNIENALRQQMKAILVNPRRLASYSADQQSIIRDIAMGNGPRNSLRLISKIAATGIVSLAGITYIAQHLGLGPVGEALMGGTGYAALKTGQWITKNRINGLLDSVRADSPLGMSLNVPTTPSMFANLKKGPVTTFNRPTTVGAKGVVGPAAMRQVTQNVDQTAAGGPNQSPPTTATAAPPVPAKTAAVPPPPGSGTKDAPFQATTQAHIDWFKNSAPPGTVISVNGKLYKK